MLQPVNPKAFARRFDFDFEMNKFKRNSSNAIMFNLKEFGESSFDIIGKILFFIAILMESDLKFYFNERQWVMGDVENIINHNSNIVHHLSDFNIITLYFNRNDEDNKAMLELNYYEENVHVSTDGFRTIDILGVNSLSGLNSYPFNDVFKKFPPKDTNDIYNYNYDWMTYLENSICKGVKFKELRL